jgi:hypothetical protein
LDAVAGSATAWRRNPHAVSRVTPRSILLSLGADADAIKLEGAATAVWETLAEPATERELEARLGRRMATTPTELSQGIAGAVQALAAIHAIEPADG